MRIFVLLTTESVLRLTNGKIRSVGKSRGFIDGVSTQSLLRKTPQATYSMCTEAFRCARNGPKLNRIPADLDARTRAYSALPEKVSKPQACTTLLDSGCQPVDKTRVSEAGCPWNYVLM